MELNCPYCNSLLTKGNLNIHGTLLGFALVGRSYQNLYFQTESKPEQFILGSNKSMPALQCESCGVMIINKTLEIGSLSAMLILWSSKVMQLTYQKQNPDAIAAVELLSQWKEYYKPNVNDFQEYFRSDEKQMLKTFDEELNAFASNVLSDPPTIEAFVEYPEWKKLNALARNIVTKLDW